MDIHFNFLYRPPPSRRKQLTDTLFFDEFSDLLHTCNLEERKRIILGDINFHFDEPSADKVKDLLYPYDLEQCVTDSTHKSGHILDWILPRESDDLVETTTVSHDLTSNNYACSF